MQAVVQCLGGEKPVKKEKIVSEIPGAAASAVGPPGLAVALPAVNKSLL